MRIPCPHPDDERGVTLVELVIAMTVIAIGVLAVCQMMPLGSRGQTHDRLRTQAGNYAQQRVEELTAVTWTDASMALGRHPASGDEVVGSFHRIYTVSAMNPPLDNLRKVFVQVTWNSAKAETISATTYLRR